MTSQATARKLMSPAAVGRRVPAKAIAARDLPFRRLNPLPSLQEIERLLIAEALLRCRNKVAPAARILGLTREGLRKKLIRMQMLPPRRATPQSGPGGEEQPKD